MEGPASCAAVAHQSIPAKWSYNARKWPFHQKRFAMMMQVYCGVRGTCYTNETHPKPGRIHPRAGPSGTRELRKNQKQSRGS